MCPNKKGHNQPVKIYKARPVPKAEIEPALNMCLVPLGRAYDTHPSRALIVCMYWGGESSGAA
jgi:hypothetical protein